jgi:hypothetical protein
MVEIYYSAEGGSTSVDLAVIRHAGGAADKWRGLSLMARTLHEAPDTTNCMYLCRGMCTKEEIHRNEIICVELPISLSEVPHIGRRSPRSLPFPFHAGVEKRAG